MGRALCKVEVGADAAADFASEVAADGQERRQRVEAIKDGLRRRKGFAAAGPALGQP